MNPTENKFYTEKIEIDKNNHQLIYHHDKSSIKAWYTSRTNEYIIRFMTRSFCDDDAYLRFNGERDFLAVLNSIVG